MNLPSQMNGIAHELMFMLAILLLNSCTMPAIPFEPATPTEVVYEGWQEYINPAYGFKFQYPLGWTLEEIPNPVHTLYGHAVWLYPPNNADVRMQIAFRYLEEDVQLMRTGVGSGELVERGSVLFLGSQLPRHVLVLDDKDMTILYGSGEIQRGDLGFMFFLDYLGSPMDASTLTDAIEADADAIIASLQLVNETD